MKTFKIFYVALILIFTSIMSGCIGDDSAGSGGKSVAICFPNTTPSWQRNGDSLTKLLQEENFSVNIQFASDINQQKEQVAEVIESKPKCIVIGAIDSAAFTDTLEKAKEYNIPIIAFDRIIFDTDAVSYYASFDNDAIGEGMGLYFEAALNLKNGGGPYNIELFAGGPADNNAHIFFDQTMKILEPYFKTGQLVCQSGQKDFNSAAVADWNAENARPRIQKILAQHYSDKPLHAVLSPNDNIAGVLIDELQKAGKPPVLISGLDGDPDAFQRIKAGTQTFTISKDPDVLTAKCVRMIKAVVEGTQPDINDVTTYNNRVITVPAFLCTPQIIDKTNVK
ncbi:MAG: sugar-binding protein [Selenomonadaceae bacterium]|nr:sugar-binding protein [Selenomonadaceae bacterium]